MKGRIEARDVGVDYGRGTVLEDVELRVEAGEFVGLLGRNGSGKTTLLRALLGLVPEARGQVHVGGHPIAGQSRRDIARTVAWVPQEAERGFAFRVREVVAMGRNPHLGRFGPPGPEDRAAVERALERTELAPLAERLITELSGGEWRRVLIARALAQATPILVLDEPTASLDLAHQLEVLELLRDLAHSAHAVVASLHDLGQAARWCDRVVVLADTRVAATGPPREVLSARGLARWFSVDAEFRDENGVMSLGPATPLPRSRPSEERR